MLSHFYGGPTVQLAKRDFGDLMDQYFAQQGYVVVTLDNRGMSRRGPCVLRSDSSISSARSRVEDQARGAQVARDAALGRCESAWACSAGATAATRDPDDAREVVRHHRGWRIGGAGDRLDAVRHPLHRTAISARRRTMQTAMPRSGLLPWLDGLTSPLLLIHGMADDNVLFTHSTQLMAELQTRGKPFELMTYPGGNTACRHRR